MNRTPYSKSEQTSRPVPELVALLALLLSLCQATSLLPQALPGKDPQEKPGTPGEEPGETPSIERSSITVRSIKGTATIFLDEDTLSFSSADNAGGAIRVGPDSHEVEDLLFLVFTPPDIAKKPMPGENAEVVLGNGDHFWATPIGIEPVKEDDFLVLNSKIIVQEVRQRDGQVRLNMEDLRLLLFRNAFTDEIEWSRFRAGLLRTRPKNDVAHLSAGTRLTGFLEDMGRDSISFSADGVGQVKLSTAKIRALDLAELKEKEEPERIGKPSGPQVGVFLRDGGSLRGKLEDLGQEGLSLRHALLGSIFLPLESLAQVSFLGGRCQYLSDMDPAKAREHLGSLFLAKLPFKRDSNVLGNPLRMKGKTWPKGLGVHAYSRLDYDLAAKFQKFQATIGLDDSARPPSRGPAGENTGAVIFRVFLDGKLISEKPMRFTDPPQELDLRIVGGRTLSLEVDFGGKNLSAALDRANWCGARIIK